MRKKIIGFSMLAALFILFNLMIASPSYLPIDPNQPVRPLLLEDQILKESFQTILNDSELAAQERGQALAQLSESYQLLSEQTETLLERGFDHPVLTPLASYFSELSKALSDMSAAFLLTDPHKLAEANEQLKNLDQEFQSMQN